MKVRLLRVDPDRKEAAVLDEDGRRWRLLAREVDGDRGFARAAWVRLLQELPPTFEVEPVGGDRVSLSPPAEVRLRLPDGEHLAGRYQGWNHRGQANWHAIKHALHARSLAGGSRKPEDWPADPADTPAVLRRIHDRTGCRVHRWAKAGRPPSCGDCRPADAAACLGIIYEAGWLPLDRATRAALRWAADPASDTRGMVRTRDRGAGDRRVVVVDEEATKVVLAVRPGDPPAFYSVSTYRLITRRAATTARQRGNLARIARAKAAEES